MIDEVLSQNDLKESYETAPLLISKDFKLCVILLCPKFVRVYLCMRPASRVYFYTFFNLHNLLYLISAGGYLRLPHENQHYPQIKPADPVVWSLPVNSGKCLEGIGILHTEGMLDIRYLRHEKFRFVARMSSSQSI